MARTRLRQQGDLLALMEPGPVLSAPTRATVVPLLAALLLEAVAAEPVTAAEDPAKTGGRDEQDRG